MTTPNNYLPKLVNDGNVTINFPNNGTNSSSVDCGGASPIALLIPSTFVSCNLTFQSSLDGQNYKNIRDSSGNGTLLTIAAAADDHVPLDPSVFSAVRYLRIVCSSAQTSSTTIVVVMGPVWS